VVGDLVGDLFKDLILTTPVVTARRKGMITPDQRLTRMRKSFKRSRSVLTADYKYFTTPDKAAKQPCETAGGEVCKMSVNQISMVRSSHRAIR